MLSGVSLLAVSNVNNPVGLVCLPYVIWSAHFFVTHIQTEKISSWNGPTVHVCCFMLARASTKTFVSRVRKTAKKIFVSRKIRYQGHWLAEVSLYLIWTYKKFYRFLSNSDVQKLSTDVSATTQGVLCRWDTPPGTSVGPYLNSRKKTRSVRLT